MRSFLAIAALAASAASARLVNRDDGDFDGSDGSSDGSSSSGGGGTLLQQSICTGCQADGQGANGSDPGQKPSLTSNENFINFCAGADGGSTNLPITNGVQITSGSCNPVPMGAIASTENMPSSKFTFPKNLDVVKSNTNFTIEMSIQHLTTGTFVNPNTNYYSAPCFLDGNGDVVGHSHVVIQQLDSIQQTNIVDPKAFVFFKGLNTGAQNGVMSVTVADGLPAGSYRLASIHGCANHQPVLVAVAQRGSLDDIVYFAVSDDSDNTNGNGDGLGASTGGPAAGSPTALADGFTPSPAQDAAATTDTSDSSTTDDSSSTDTSDQSQDQSSTDGSDQGGFDGSDQGSFDGSDNGGFDGNFDGQRKRAAPARVAAHKRMARLSKRRLDLERSA